MDRERKIRELIPHEGLITKVIRSQVMFKSFADLKISGRSRNSQSCDPNLLGCKAEAAIHGFYPPRNDSRNVQLH